MINITYWGIIIVREGQMVVALVDNPSPRIHIPTNVYTSFCLLLIKIIPNLLPTKLRPHEPGQFCLPTNIDPPRIKMNPRYWVLQFSKRFQTIQQGDLTLLLRFIISANPIWGCFQTSERFLCKLFLFIAFIHMKN